jgi:hypothetical protein
MAVRHRTPDGPVTGLRATLEVAMAQDRLTMKDLTVLAPQRDPFRVDTPAGHRDGRWFKDVAERALELKGSDSIHLRGCHYAALSMEATKPNGQRYANSEEDWDWMQSKAAKAGRWLRYVGFDKITDERNVPPVVRLWTPPEPKSVISVGDVEIVVPDDLAPQPLLIDYRGIQPYRLSIFGEKTSLEDVLAPVAESRMADLYLPTGESSDTLVYLMARDAAEDGRPLVVLYFSDCDPDGYGMGRSVARKLQAFKALQFPELEFELRPVALTPDQVKEHGLPSTPFVTKAKTTNALKAAETKRRRWVDAFGIEQTEIDSIATLNPDLLRRLAMEATRPFFDSGLDARAREKRREWEARAQQVIENEIGKGQLTQRRADAEAKLAELHEQVEALKDALEGVELPEIPDVIEGQADIDGSLPSPLIDSKWDFAEQCQRLISHKSYERS